MTHPDHVKLISPGIKKNSAGVWADVGSGTGAFTLALRDITGPEVTIYSIDKDTDSLKEQQEKFDTQFPNTKIYYRTADFTQPLNLPPLDGLIAANAIHFTRNTLVTIKHLASYIKPQGSFIIIEYNTDDGNHWVPYPFSFPTLQSLARQTNLKNPELLATIPSNFLKEIYAAKATT